MKTILGLMLVLALTIGTARAQDATILQQEMAEIRDDIQLLRRQVYAAKNSDGESKYGRLDEIVRTANGRLEELEHKIQQLDEKIDLINKDIDVRMKLLEGKKIEGGSGIVADNTPKFAAPMAENAPKALVGGTISKADDLQPVKLPTAAEIYQKGLEALKAADYAAAEENFSKVLQKYPDDKLAGNAQYWLGETYYGRKAFEQAAVAFAKGYQNYKNSPKGPDSLLKLGMSMLALNKKAEACAAFVSLPKEFPKAGDVIMKKAADEAKKSDCK